MVTVSCELLCQVHRYILNNTDEVQPYTNEHIDYIRRTNSAKSRREKGVIDEHNKSFIKWFRNQVADQLLTISICVPEKFEMVSAWASHGRRVIP